MPRTVEADDLKPGDRVAGLVIDDVQVTDGEGVGVTFTNGTFVAYGNGEQIPANRG